MLEDGIAIVGMACRFPGAKDYHQFWDNLEKGKSSITEVPSNRWDIEKFYSSNPDEPNKSISKWGGFIEDADKFDPMFFGISPREAILLDPQQRLMLELSWSCLEDSGYSPAELSGTNVGVFVGVCNFDYKELLEKYQNNVEGHTSTGTYTSIIPNRISYFFNFHGISVPVDTACSSSLVAIHQAINALKENECAMALVGGVNVLCTPTYYISFSKLGMLSPQGQCKTFDAKADGYVRGEGAGVILLKPLKNAIKDKDYIYGVIRGSAVNHGGAARTLTSPNAYAQSQVIRSAYTKANIPPNTVSYIEAHGTGTPLGDPIEINGLKRAFTQLYQQYGMDAANEPYCGLSTVKTNIGHLESAAGIAGIIKVLLAMKHKKLPKITNYQHLNPRIKLDGSPFYIVEETKYWEQLRTKEGDIIPRRAGVSSFGFGGVNAHVVLEEAPALLSRSEKVERTFQLFTLSAKSEKGLLELAQSYEDFLATNAESSLANVCFTANIGRSHFEHRLVLAAKSILELREHLLAFASGEETIGLVSGLSSRHPKIAFLFTGQGSQYVGMGRLLYETQPTFRAALDRCDEILRPYLELPLLSVLYPQAGETSPLNETAYTQPALFALEYALFQLWKSWGIGPDAVMGHSVGEYVAACVAGVFSLEDGLKLIASRGRLMQALPQDGEMVALLASAATVAPVIQPYLQFVAIAALNGAESIVISGKRQVVRLIVAKLEAVGVKATFLQVSHAFHSPLMEPMLAEFAQVASEVTYSLPQIDLIANVTGDLATSEVATAEYWCQHVRQPVQFAAGMEALFRAGYEVFVECGPKPILLGMGRKCLPEGVGRWLPSLRPGQEDWQQILQSLAQLYVEGVQVDWFGFDRGYERRKVVLPTYPFQRQRYWIEIPEDQVHKTQFLSTDINGSQPLHRDWFYSLNWEPSSRDNDHSAVKPDKPGSWLILSDSVGIGVSLAERLQQEGEQTILVSPGESYQKLAAQHYQINPQTAQDYQRLIQETQLSAPYRGVVHCWSLESAISTASNIDKIKRGQILGCGSTLYLVQVLIQASWSPRLWLITKGAMAVGNESSLQVEQAPLWGLGRTLALEHPELKPVLIDLEPSTQKEEVATLFSDLWQPDRENQIAYRQGTRYIARLRRDRQFNSNNQEAKIFQRLIKEQASYLITGGLGALGLQVAQWMVSVGARHLVLVGRTDATSEALDKIDHLKQTGSEVLVVKADVSEPQEVEQLLAQIKATLRPLRGIIHAAGVLNDRVLQQLDWECMEQVMAPKIAGTWNLHAQTQQLPLDFYKDSSISRLSPTREMPLSKIWLSSSAASTSAWERFSR